MSESKHTRSSSLTNELRNRKLNGLHKSTDLNESDTINNDKLNESNETAKSTKPKLIRRSSSSTNLNNNDELSFQIKISLPFCFLFTVAFLMRFWLIDYPKSIV